MRPLSIDLPHATDHRKQQTLGVRCWRNQTAHGKWLSSAQARPAALTCSVQQKLIHLDSSAMTTR